MSLEQYLPEKLRSRYAIKLLGLSLLIVAIITATGSVMAIQLSERVEEDQLQSVQANAELEADALARWIEGEQESIRILSTHDGIDPDNPTETSQALSRELAEMPGELAALHLAERPADPPTNGTTEQVIASTDGLGGQQLQETNINWGEDTDGDDRQYSFDGQNDVIMSWVYFDGDEQSVAMASPTDDEHVLIGEYRTSTRAEQFTSVVEGTETVVLGGVSAFVIFDESNPDEFRRYKGDRESTEVGQAILERDDPFSIISGSEIDDEEIRGYHSVPGEKTDWVVVKQAPRSNALALTEQVQTDLVILIGTMVFGFLLIGLVIQYSPIRAIKRLSRQSNAIAEGNLSVEIEDGNRIDEIGELRASFRNTKEYIETITRQTEALSQQEFDNDVLDEEIPGRVGESMRTMRADLERFITELEAERERYSTLVEQSTDGIVVVQDGTYVFANDRVLEITGYDREQLLGMDFEQVVVPEDRERVRKRHEQRLDGNQPTEQYELRIKTNQGERRTVEISASQIEHDDDSAALVNVRDVTERQRRETRLEIFNRVLRHNLRNDLQVVNGVLEEIDDDSLPAGVSVSAAQQTTDELQATAKTARRIERAFEQIEISQYDLAEVLSPLESRVRDRYPDATFSPLEATVRVEAANVLGEALWELLENALEHSGENPHVELTLDVEDTMAILCISDDGPGVPRNEREILERDEETNLKHANGLGLWFAHWTVEASGGELSFEVDDGTTACVMLPIVEQSGQTDV